MDYKIIFVPGRLCLFGEHSDTLAATVFCGKDKIGHTLATPLHDIGIRATVKCNGENVLEITNNKLGDFKCTLDSSLDQYINYSKIFSYVAGTTKLMIEVCNSKHTDVTGVSINIESNTLPIGVGLSSSAAICTLIVKAFDYVCNLELDDKSIMYYAWIGENEYTNSKCGRLDQICAYSGGLVHIKHKSKDIIYDDVKVKKDMNFVIIVDPSHTKNTVDILQQLKSVFLYPEHDRRYKSLDKYYFDDNEDIVYNAMNYIFNGDLYNLGKLMTMSQLGLDTIISDIVPSISDANLEPIFEYIHDKVYGYKGMGSHGGSSAIALCYDESSRDDLIESLNRTFPSLILYPIDILAQ